MQDLNRWHSTNVNRQRSTLAGNIKVRYVKRADSPLQWQNIACLVCEFRPQTIGT